ncbi:hypothetical protein FEK34_02035 [Nocardia cyriacigeorgica]|uniref:DUF3592 domain-containing protein n=2 Tax=Nocardia cyriacigeorgica TaxID=135487 RepID=A0A5R8P0Z8_9NOCA|nr:hypothetical protein FEK34_02035 [Nocardia cyriacigeorgica]
MGRTKPLIGPMALVWTLGVPVAAFFFMAGTVKLVGALADLFGPDLATVLVLPASALLGIPAWMLLLSVAWRLRRDYVRRVGSPVEAVVVESDLRCKHSRAFFGFDLWRVRIETRFVHPDTGDEVRVRKEYFYHQFRESRARAMVEQLHAGATLPVVVHKKSAILEIPKRPVWTDIW